MSRTATYSLIASQTLGTANTTVTFSSIPATFTDLILITNGAVSSGAANWNLQVGNGSVDTGTNYSETDLWGTGSVAASARGSNQSNILLNSYGYLDTTFSANVICNLLDYSNTTTYKTFIQRANNATNGTHVGVGLWRSTAAINTIKIMTGNTFVTGTTFKLYGIQAGSN